MRPNKVTIIDVSKYKIYYYISHAVQIALSNDITKDIRKYRDIHKWLVYKELRYNTNIIPKEDQICKSKIIQLSLNTYRYRQNKT